MADAVTRMADAQAAAYAKKIEKVYTQAAKEVKKKMDDFWKAHKEKAKRLRKQVQAGVISERDYQAWLRGQVFQGKQWEQKLKDVTEVYVNADAKAREILGGTTKNVFMEAANHTAYDIEKQLGGAVAFNVYDKKTVERLTKDNPKMLPEWKIDEPKDYVWNEKRVQNAVTQGIIQGESIEEVGERLTSELATSNAKKMDMFARTAINGAQNAGRMDRLHEAEEMGIEVRKKWLATLDKRTRDAHADLDGQEAEVDEPFQSQLGPIMYPGDPLADPANTYNCRCTLTYVYPKYQHLQHDHERRDQLNDKNIENMTYYEWVGLKKKCDGKSQPSEKKYSFQNDKSFAASLGGELSPYSYEIPTYEEYREKREAWGNKELTKYIEDVKPGTTIDFKSDYSFYGEPHCAASRVDNAIARCQEKVPLFGEREKLVVCDYENAKYYLPDGDSDRRLSTDAIAQVFENEGQTVIAVNREWMTGTLQESLESRANAIKKGEVLSNVFPVTSPEAVILHEWGHTVHDYFLDAMCYDDKDAKGLWDWFNTLSKDDIKTGLSDYASENFGEFCAECFAEMQASDPRPIAQKYWSFMGKILKKGGKYD